VLAIDLGERRMGLAMSDPLRIAAQALPTVERRNRREDMNYLKSLARRHGISLIVIGNPVNMDGTAGTQSLAASEFASRLQRHLEAGPAAAAHIAVRLWDERLTSVQANRLLRESGVAPPERSQKVDQIAALLLLQNFLDAQCPVPAQPDNHD
jgi:putative Holliday junction resolvase